MTHLAHGLLFPARSNFTPGSATGSTDGLIEGSYRSISKYNPIFFHALNSVIHLHN